MATRRWFLKTSGVATLALASSPSIAEPAPGDTPPLPSEHVSLTINGRRYALKLDPRTTLLDALREHLGFTGSKKGCDQGQCGACTIIVNGQRINSCLALAVMHDGDEITTSRVRAPRRISMRVLHTRSDLLSCRARGRAQGGLAKLGDDGRRDRAGADRC
jgi:ferredoxin